jgi:hypothetical protein
MRRAQDELDAARALLGRAISLRDTQAAYYRAKIDDASHDGLTDSWWDHVENWWTTTPVSSPTYATRWSGWRPAWPSPR